MEKVDCEPCKKRGKEEGSIKWCVICEEYLCYECTENHLAMKISGKHNLFDIDKIPVRYGIPDKNCQEHDNMSFEYLCIDHDILSCKECFAENHHTCKKIVSVDKACNGYKESFVFMESIDLLNEILETTNKILVDRTTALENLNKSEVLIKEAIRESKEKILGHIRNLEETLLADFKTRKEKVNEHINTQIRDARGIAEEARQTKDSFSNVKQHGTDRQSLLVAYANRNTISKLKEEISLLCKRLNVEELRIVDKLTPDNLPALGKIVACVAKSSIAFVSTKDRQSQIQIREGQTLPTFQHQVNLDLTKFHTVDILGMAATDELILLADYHTDANRLIIYDKENEYQGEIDTTYQTWDVAILPEKDKCVLTFQHKKVVQFIDFRNRKILKTTDITGTSGSGIAANEENIFVSSKGKIRVLDHGGNELSSIEIGNNEQAWYIALGKDGTVIYSCSKANGNKVCCIRLDGEVVFTYTLPDNDTPWKIAVDERGYIYVVAASGGIYRLTHEGKVIDVIFKEPAFNWPCAVCFNASCTKMYLSSEDGKIVSVFSPI